MKIIIASHGEYSSGILSALQVIFGDNLPYVVNAYSLNIGENVNDLAEKISEEIDEDELTIILTDLLGGSVDNALFPLINKKNVQIITGINLSLVLEIMMLKDTENLEQDIDIIIENSRNSLVSKNKLAKVVENNNSCNDDLDFED